MNKHDRKFMRLTIEKAKEGIGKGQTPFAATIVKGDTVLSCAHNIVWQTQDITAHA
ncbi:MAG: nucleoside deaminase, partial [Candidatus Omnitrophica bacterium]|nr:nucleoside deaminase [Candidatus Omnitrophota bacterium]MBU1925334.1 nucleoside deaminase [Candidatus Omnitrophota bacterium]